MSTPLKRATKQQAKHTSLLPHYQDGVWQYPKSFKAHETTKLGMSLHYNAKETMGRGVLYGITTGLATSLYYGITQSDGSLFDPDILLQTSVLSGILSYGIAIQAKQLGMELHGEKAEKEINAVRKAKHILEDFQQNADLHPDFKNANGMSEFNRMVELSDALSNYKSVHKIENLTSAFALAGSVIGGAFVLYTTPLKTEQDAPPIETQTKEITLSPEDLSQGPRLNPDTTVHFVPQFYPTPALR